MISPPASSARRSPSRGTPSRYALAATLALLALAPLGASAQRPDSAASRPLCFRGQPAPACHSFILTEVGFYRAFATSKTAFVVPGDPNSTYPREPDFRSQLTWEVGAMTNHGPRTAYGGTLLLGIPSEDGGEIGVKGRARRWLGPDGTALDVGLGVVKGEGTSPTTGSRTGMGLTADVALNAADYGAIVLRYDRMSAGGHHSSALSGGVRLGSKPALVGTGLLAAGFVIVLAAFLSGGGID